MYKALGKTKVKGRPGGRKRHHSQTLLVASSPDSVVSNQRLDLPNTAWRVSSGEFRAEP